jgi:S1-C subfamily serine protease
MLRTGMIMVLGAALMAPAAASAQSGTGQVRVQRAPRGTAPDEVIRVLTNRRVRLGVNVDLQAESTDTIGARLEGVTPGGPADKAGLRAGDIITRLDGQPLVSRTAAGRNGRQSIPGMRLIELAAKLEPNDTVAVEYRRGNDRHTASLVTADEVSTFTFNTDSTRFTYNRLLPMVRGGMGRLEAPAALWMFGSPLGELELAPINPELGEYFGVTEGVLVIDAPDDSALKLRGGDVVLTVDGREPSNPQHLLRILRSYEPGETVRMEIQRNRRRETITSTIEEKTVRAEQMWFQNQRER